MRHQIRIVKTAPPSCPQRATIVTAAPVDGHAAACVFFTSGPTGTPKGAISPHRSPIRTLVNHPTITLDADTTFLQAAPLSWDGLSLGLWAPLLNGGRSALLGKGKRVLDVDAWEAALDLGVDSMWLTSSLFNVFAEERPELFRRLRLLLVGGERVSPAHVRRVFAAAPGAAFPRSAVPRICSRRQRDEAARPGRQGIHAAPAA